MEASKAMTASTPPTHRHTRHTIDHRPHDVRNRHRRHGTQSRNSRSRSRLAGKRARRPQPDSPRPPFCRANLALSVLERPTGTGVASVREASFDTTRCRNPFVNWRLRRGRIDACKPRLLGKGNLVAAIDDDSRRPCLPPGFPCVAWQNTKTSKDGQATNRNRIRRFPFAARPAQKGCYGDNLQLGL